ncbi:MAG: sensor hybrid histidine kinase [Bacilli bacterium]|nr:sensor hybrid histidine kinase [Bacilli bacterium]
MTIKTKLRIAFSIIFLTIVFLLLNSISSIKKLNNSVDDIVNVEYAKVELASTVRNDVNDLGKALRNYILSDSDNIKEMQITKINQDRDHGGKALLDLEKMTSDEQGTLIINHLKIVGADYLTFQQDVINKAKAGSISEASNMLTLDSAKYQLNLYNLVEDLINLNKVSMKKAVEDAKATYRQALIKLLSTAIFYLILGIVLSMMLTKRLTQGLTKVSSVMEGFSKGTYDLSTRLDETLNDEISTVSKAFNQMAASLQQQSSREKEWSLRIEEESWLHESMSKLFTLIQEIDDMQIASERTLSVIMPQLGASFGVLYLTQETEDGTKWLKKMAGYGTNDLEAETHGNTVQFGEGLVGQSAMERKIIQLSDVPPEYYKIQSGLGITAPSEIIIIPLLIGSVLKGVIELANLKKFTKIQIEFLTQMSILFAIHINKIKNKLKIEALYDQSQMIANDLRLQSEELLLQQEELAKMNAELEEQTAALEVSESQLQLQQLDLEDQNRTLKKTTLDLERKTQELTDAINYKALFLANMSHELRTPLNSMLILARLLAENKDKNLSTKQVEYASIVYSSGCDLLTLINEILELAKVESKKTELSFERIELQQIVEYVQRNFEPIAQQKGLEFNIIVEKGSPPAFYSDQQRLLQILQNLLSNAFKFTEQGSISFSIVCNGKENDLLQKPNMQWIEFIIRDSGIGIEQAKWDIIFDAFVQADGTTSRKYGGTGLGLSISKEFASLLGGEVLLQSVYGKGSTFTLVIPVEVETINPTREENAKVAVTQENQIINQKSTHIRSLENKLILIVDDDIRNVFALTNVIESYGLTVLYAENGRDAIEMLAKHAKIDAVLMDIMMPEMDGYETMRQIRKNPKYQDLPIIAVTAKAMKDDKDKCIQAGASDYITKPVDIDQLFSLLKVWLYA